MVLTRKEATLVSEIIAANNALLHSNVKKSLLKSPALKNMISSGIIQQRLQARVKCPSCTSQMEDRLGTTLVCMNCGHQIDLKTPEGAQFTVYRVSPENLASIIKDSISEAGFETGNLPNLGIAGVQGVCQIQKEDSSTCNLLLIYKPFDKTTLYALLGAAAVEKANLAVLYGACDSTTTAEEVDALSFPRMIPIPITNLPQQSYFKHLSSFISLSSFLSSIIYSIKESTNSNQRFVLTRNELDFLDNAKTQSISGGVDFEPIALRLLQVLGITSRFEAGGYGPDGMLWLPTEFYIVDAKSTKSHFDFKVSERDKIHRYIRTIEENEDLLDDYQFSGEIIITPELAEPYSDVLDKVENYFLSNNVKGRLVVISSDSLIELYKNAFTKSEYFHRLRPKKHVSGLLRGDILSELRYTKVVYISRKTMNAFLTSVLDSPVLGLRSVSYLKEWVESQF